MKYDAVLILSFGGPEGPADVLPFLENVLRGRNVPRERMLEVAHHYDQFGGISPINGHNRALVAALEVELAAHGLKLPVYWGNRNWHPLLADTMRAMTEAGLRQVITFVTSAYSSYSGCRQYREDIERARQVVGVAAPAVDKLRVFFNHPGFVEPMIERVETAFSQIPVERRAAARIAFTAHSVPLSMAQSSRYQQQLTEASRLIVAGLIGGTIAPAAALTDWRLVYQSRSGPATQPWLEPDIGDHLRALHAAGVRDVVVVPVGFISDHMEVLFDLDTEAKAVSQQLGLNMVRAGTVGCHPRFVRMIRELIEERISGPAVRMAIGDFPANHDVCPLECCPAPQRPPVAGRPD